MTSALFCSSYHIVIQYVFKRNFNSNLDYYYKVYISLLTFIFSYSLSNTCSFSFRFQISLIALLLGELFCTGSMIAYFGPIYLKPFGVYINLLTFFHFSEFFLTAIINPETLNLDSYLLQNGNPYYIALLVSWTEYFIEVYYFRELKYLSYLSLFGITLSIIGELFRKTAMVLSFKFVNLSSLNLKC